MKALNLRNLVCFLFVVFVTGSCAVHEPLVPLKSVDGEVVLKNGNVEKGKVSILKPKEVSVNDKIITSSDVKEVQFYNKNIPEIKYVLKYMPINKRRKFWIAKMGEGEHLTTYIGAPAYEVNDKGVLIITGYVVVSGRSASPPSFPVFMMKKGAEKMKQVGLHKGVSKENAFLRAGISRYLRDDPEFCEYIRYKKLGFDDLELITRNYTPNRQGRLTIDGKKVRKIKPPFITYDLDNELIYNFELGFPTLKYYGLQYSLGFNSFKKRFFSYGFNIRFETFTSPPANDPLYEDFASSFPFFITSAGYLGAALPMSIKGKFYIVPGMHVFAGMRFGGGPSLVFGPMPNVDFGFKLRDVGDILLVGVGYRYNKCTSLFSRRFIDSSSSFALEPFGTVFIRLSYKF